MKKSWLCSAILHFFLFSFLFAGFKIKQPEESKSSEIKVGIMIVQNNSNILNPNLPNPQNNQIITRNNIDSPKPLQTKKPEINSQPKQTAKKSSSQKIYQPKENLDESKNQVKPQNETPNLAKKIEDTAPKTETEYKPNQPELPNESQNLPTSPQEVEKLEELPKEEKPNIILQNNALSTNGDRASSLPRDNSVINFQANGLSIREKINIQTQIRACYQRAIIDSGFANEVKIAIKAKIDREGNITVIDNNKLQHKENNQKFRNAIENAERTIELCSPLRNVAQDKIELVKEVIFEFEPD